MNKKHLIFFADTGLTSTSANHIANLAKEYYQEEESKLLNYKFYDEYITLLPSTEKIQILQGDKTPSLELIPSLLDKVAKAKSLIAWLREAIKARALLIDNTTHLSIFEYCNIVDLKAPEVILRERHLTEDDYYSTLSVKERNTYYWLETQVSTIGKYIHNSGVFANARKEHKDKIQNPIIQENTDNGILIHNFCTSVSSCKMDEVFFELQAKHRQYQAQLNKIKFDCESAILKDKTEKDTKYNLESTKYTTEMSKINESYNKYIREETQRINNFKIIIPKDLQDIYNEITALGK